MEAHLMQQVAEILSDEADPKGIVKIETEALRERLWPAGDSPYSWRTIIYDAFDDLCNDGAIVSWDTHCANCDEEPEEICTVELKRISIVKGKS